MSLPAALHDRSLRRPFFVLLVLVTVVVSGEHALTVAFAGIGEGTTDLPVWLPRLGSVGETVLFYTTLVDALKFIAIPVSVIWLAYNYGRHHDDPSDK